MRIDKVQSTAPTCILLPHTLCSHPIRCNNTTTIIFFLLILLLFFFLQAFCVHWLFLSCSLLPPPLPLPHHSGPVRPVFFIALHRLLCVCVFLPVWLCVYSNLSKHSLAWELRDPLCVLCGVWAAWAANPSHTHSCARTHTRVHTPQGLNPERQRATVVEFNSQI